MKKVLKLVAILFGIGIIAGCINTPSKERMNEELKKPEVVEVIEKTIKNIEKNISGENNKIINYEIDYEKLIKMLVGESRLKFLLMGIEILE